MAVLCIIRIVLYFVLYLYYVLSFPGPELCAFRNWGLPSGSAPSERTHPRPTPPRGAGVGWCTWSTWSAVGNLCIRAAAVPARTESGGEELPRPHAHTNTEYCTLEYE